MLFPDIAQLEPFDELRREFLRMCTVEERLEGLSVKERLQGLSLEERLKGLSQVDRLAGLTPKELLALLSAEKREAIRKLLDADVVDEAQST